jgi:hypothetical protein
MKRLLFAFSVLLLLFSAACSGGGPTIQPPPPTGKYSVGSLKGQYAFSTSGEVFANGATTATPLTRTGSFTADGTGVIQTGIEDVVEPGVLPNLAIPITGGSYTVNSDGRGTLTLNVTSASGPSTLNFGLVLTSTSDGRMIDETSTQSQASTGSGNFILQNASTFTNPVLPTTATYVFDFSGQDGNGAPDSLVGEFAAGNGAINGGFEDANFNFSTTSGSIPQGTLTQDTANPSTLGAFGRGTAQLGGESYVFYIVDSTRLRFLSTGGGFMLSGDSVIQTSVPTSLTGGFAFIVAGSSVNSGITRVGRFTVSGTSLSNVLADTNSGGKFALTNSGTNTSISLDAANPGRGILSFTDPSFPSAPISFVFYLSSATQGVIQETTAPGGVVENVADGTIAAQSGSPFTSSNITGTYAMNWSGVVQAGNGVQDEEDFLAQTSVSSLALKGTADLFQFQSLQPTTNIGLGGTVTIGGDGTGRSTMTVNLSGISPINMAVYFVTPQLAFFQNNSNSGATRIVAGDLQTQQ